MKHGSNLQHHDSYSPNASLCYKPYPKGPSPFFLDSESASTLCIQCGFKGHREATCSSEQSSQPKHPIIVSWKENHLETANASHICLHFNIRTTCMIQLSPCHGIHYFSLCGDS